MFARSLAAISTIAAFLSWFFKETITHWFFGKVVESVDSHVEMLVEYGVPAVFAAVALYLLWSGSDLPTFPSVFAEGRGLAVVHEIQGNHSWGADGAAIWDDPGRHLGQRRRSHFPTLAGRSKAPSIDQVGTP